MHKKINIKDTIFVAGHQGMVGSAIVRALKRNGYCNYKNGGKLLTQTREELDLCSFDKVMDWFQKNKPSIVVLAAAKVGGIYANQNSPFDFISENLKIQQNVIEAAWKNKTRRLLFLGSSCIYPKKSKLPIKEDELLSSYLEKTNETYAIAKIAGLKFCEALRTQYNFDSISLMPTNLYGQGDNYHLKESHVMAALIRKILMAKRENLDTVTCWGSGKPLREFLHVDDLASACIKMLENWSPELPNSPKDNDGNNLYFLNVGTEEEISIKDLAIKIAKIIKYKGKIIWDKNKPDGTFSKKLDTSRIKSLGWFPNISLEEGIKSVVSNIENSLDDDSDKGYSLKNFFKNN